MEGWQIPVAVAHGEGRASFQGSSKKLQTIINSNSVYRTAKVQCHLHYPSNPNGSPEGITGLTSMDGRATIMMPHPERVFRAQQLSWQPSAWEEYSPMDANFYKCL